MQTFPVPIVHSGWAGLSVLTEVSYAPDAMSLEHERWMRLAIEEGELARGTTGDNPWVGCAIVSPRGELLGRGHTLGPGENHAEIAAALDAYARGHSVVGATLYSTLEPCSFHGRTPACSRSIAGRGIVRVVIGMRDPHPRVNGAGTLILRQAKVEVIEGVCEPEVRRQLGFWVLEQHPYEALRCAQAVPEQQRVAHLAEIYGVNWSCIEAFFLKHPLSTDDRSKSHTPGALPTDGLQPTADAVTNSEECLAKPHEWSRPAADR